MEVRRRSGQPGRSGKNILSTPKRWKQWRITRVQLESARNLLPKNPTENDGSNRAEEIGTIQSYREYLEHNELELALDQLEALGDLNNAPSGFWRSLAQAATWMGLHERAEQYQTVCESATRHQDGPSDPTTG